MSTEKVKLILNNVLLALQFSLGVWQFMKLTPVGALIQGAFGWLLRPLGFSPTYYRLQHCPGRVFKRAYCFTLQTDIPSERRDIVRNEVNTIELEYLGSNLLLERKGTDGNMLFVNKKMCYYITRTIWDELQTLEDVLSYGLAGPPIVKTDVARARAEYLHAAATEATHAAATVAAAESTRAAAAAAAAESSLSAATAAAAKSRLRASYASCVTAGTTKPADWGADFNGALYAYKADCDALHSALSSDDRATLDAAAAAATAAAAAATVATDAADGNLARAAAAARAAARSAAADGHAMQLDAAANICDRAAAAFAAAAFANSASQILFVQCNRHFWKGIITGGVMTLEQVVDAIILYNHHVSVRLNNDWLLPINLSVSEERLLKFLNLIALFLQTKKVEVHWFLPTCLSLISAVLEFSTRVRVLLYTKINILFCYIVHFICDPLPYSWRQQVYSLGKWVENLTPCNDIQLKVVRGNISAIITEGAKVAIITEGAKVEEGAIITEDAEVDQEGAIAIITEGAKVEEGAIITEDAEVDQEGAIITEDAEVDQEGAIRVPWLGVPDDEEGTLNFGFIEKKFSCNPTDITCTYLTGKQVCEISAPTISEFYVKCQNDDDFSHIITLVSCIADSRCGSLISYGPNKKVRVRGFEESITSYVDNGLPYVYTLELANVDVV